MVYVTEEWANKVASEDWPIARIKGAHDIHVHGTTKCLPCPECRYCRCPVPVTAHRDLPDSWYETP